jgi:uncharacterized OB-fold protein
MTIKIKCKKCGKSFSYWGFYKDEICWYCGEKNKVPVSSKLAKEENNYG